MTHVSRSFSVRQALHLHIDPSPYNTQLSIVGDSSPGSSSTHLSGTTSDTTPTSTSPNPVLCSVLCLYDFVTDEAGLLPFHKNEILEIVKKEGTGWWAAMRRGGAIVGWVPEAFVKPLTTEMADRLRLMREELRYYEYEVEQLYNSAPISQVHPHDSGVDTELSPAARSGDIRTQTPSSPRYLSAQSTTQGDENVNPYSSSSESRRHRPQPPPSPSGPMPHPPSHSAPLYHKPTPPLPCEQGDPPRTRAHSFSNRGIRRRPVMLDDNTTLSRLSTLIETNNTKEIDKLASPDIVGSFEALSRRSRNDRFRARNSSQDGRNLQHSFHVFNKPWYLLPTHADELELDKDGHVRAGSLLAFIERLTSDLAFSDPNRPNERGPFPSVFLMTFRTFTTPEKLFDLLLERFGMGRPDNINEKEVEDWKKGCLLPTQRRVLDVFALWLEEHRLLDEEPHIAQRLPDFLFKVVNPLLPLEATALVQTIERLTFADPVRPSIAVSPRKSRKSKAHKNDLLKLDASDVAEQLTLHECQLYSKVTPKECLSYAKTQSGDEVHNLLAFISTYDKLAGWVKTSVLENDVVAKRADTADFWIKVAEKCRHLNNFASMSAIISGLSSTVITKLHLTWAHIGRKSSLDSLLKYNEPTGGFSGYRNLIASVDGSCVPFITMYLSDILRIREQYSDKPNRICFIQRFRWHETISLMLKFQNRPYAIGYSESTATFIQSHLKTGGMRNETWFWAKSQEVQQAELAHADIRKGLEAAGF